LLHAHAQLRAGFGRIRAAIGQHTIEVRAYGTERTVAFDDAFTAFALK